jgi:methylated-DNA-[protein]-cysteine S-methyltransferase
MPALRAETLFLDRMPTPIGTMLVVADDQARLRALDWEDHETRFHDLLRRHYGAGIDLRAAPPVAAVRGPLEAYFAGDLGAVAGIAVHCGGTVFQRAVWSALRGIPVGETMSYGGLAAAIGRPKAVRAVGLANGANPIGIVVPCHRVIGADGSLTGYGGGLFRKRWLLHHERTGVWGRLAPAGSASDPPDRCQGAAPLLSLP